MRASPRTRLTDADGVRGGLLPRPQPRSTDPGSLAGALGHVAVRTRELRLDRADDAAQLLTAAQRGWVFVTHNGRDFKLLHTAWRLWPAPLQHAGVLVIPQHRWSAPETAERLDRFVNSGAVLTNELYEWTATRGWMPVERLPRR
jgi:hypothetical protein